MLRKFFPGDKNYIVEDVQLSMRQTLLQFLVDQVKEFYLLQHNPLGIEDGRIKCIRNHDGRDFRHLHEFYASLMAVYRYRYHADNQLSFDFSGRDLAERYRQEWTAQFEKWIKSFCMQPAFLRTVLDLTVFYPADCSALTMDTRMQSFITRFFGVAVHPSRGIVRKKVA